LVQRILHFRDQTEGPLLPHLLHGSCVGRVEHKVDETRKGVENLQMGNHHEIINTFSFNICFYKPI